MTDDLEARLRAALHAYAERVEDTDADLPRVRGSSARGPELRRWRGALLVAAAVVAVLGGSWWIAAGRPGGDVVAGSRSSSSSSSEAGTDEARSAAASPSDDGVLSSTEADTVLPTTGLPPAPDVGVPYALDLYTHCGILGTDIGGTWFAADPPLVQDYSPPEGWGNPYQPGTLTLTSADRAVFTDDLGHRVRLAAAPAARPGPCA